MKILSTLFAIVFATLATQAEGTTIAGVEGLTLLSAGDSVSGTSNFLNYASFYDTDIISQTTLHSNLTDNELGSYVFSKAADAYIDMSFNSTSIFNGAGNDLAFFFAGKIDGAIPPNVVINFDLSINGITNKYTPVMTPEELYLPLIDGSGYARMTVALIDLDDFGLGFASTTALQDLRVLLGSNNALNKPSLSMVGAFNTSPMVVPLPLPILLFASGLGVLGLFGRRKTLK